LFKKNNPASDIICGKESPTLLPSLNREKTKSDYFFFFAFFFAIFLSPNLLKKIWIIYFIFLQIADQLFTKNFKKQLIILFFHFKKVCQV